MHHFDDVAKALASGLTRRRALRRVGVGLAGALLGSLGLGRARGQAPTPKNCADYCKNFLGIRPGHGNAYGQCVSNCATCLAAGGTACGADACCTDGQGCCDGTCTDLTTTSDCGSCGNACPSDDCRAATCTDGVCGGTPINEGGSCHDGAGTCHDGVCGDSAGVCGDFRCSPPRTSCEGNDNCTCLTTPEGIDACVFIGGSCQFAIACTSSADCPVGYVCADASCACRVPTCFPYC